MQYSKSFEAWCTMMAQDRIGSDQAGREDGTPGYKGTGSDLTRTLKSIDHTHGGYAYEVGASLRDVAGVLYLDVEPNYEGGYYPNKPQFHHDNPPYSYTIKGARLAGFTNAVARQEARRIGLKDLKMPVIADFHTTTATSIYGMNVGRNEAGGFFASESKDGVLEEMSGQADPTAAASVIFDMLNRAGLPEIDG